MAHYDYHCTKCGEIFEAEHPMDGPDPRSPLMCPVCGTAEVSKIYLETPGVLVWFRNSGLSHNASDKAPRYMPPVIAKEVAHGRD